MPSSGSFQILLWWPFDLLPRFMVATLSGGEQGGTSLCHLVLDHRALMAALSFALFFSFIRNTTMFFGVYISFFILLGFMNFTSMGKFLFVEI